jgi:anti-anti-sigma regulatory factor
VTIRIDTTHNESATVVYVAGRLKGDAVGELSSECARIGGPFTLDLDDLVSADAAGIRLLRGLHKSGAEVRGLTPYLQLLVDDEQ